MFAEWANVARNIISGLQDKIPRAFLFDSSTRRVFLAGQDLTTVNLCDIGKMSNLESLILDNNRLHSVDLSCLESLNSLTTLSLAENRIEEIDLRPLAKCRELAWLSLSGNLLKEIDLGPLAKCAELERLFIGGSKMEVIDLAPLSSCPRLKEVVISRDGDPGFDAIEKAIDLSPLVTNRRLRRIQAAREHYVTLGLVGKSLAYVPRAINVCLKHSRNVSVEEIVSEQIRTLGPVKGVAKLENEVNRLDPSYWYSVRRDVLRPLNLEPLAGFDGSISELMKQVKLDSDWADLVTAKAADIIAAGSSSILFDLDQIPMTLPSHGKLRAAVLENRTSEIKNARIFVCENCADLREVLYTAWGFKVLSQMGNWVFGTSGNQLIRLRDNLRELGFGLTFVPVQLRDRWPRPRNEPSLKIRQTILGHIDRNAKTDLKEKALKCLANSELHPLRSVAEVMLSEVYGTGGDRRERN